MTATLPAATDAATAVGTVVPRALVAALDAVMPHACKISDCMPLLASVEISARDGVLTFAATDRYTLGAYSLPWDGPEIESAVLPIDSAKALQRYARSAPSKALRTLPSLALQVTDRDVTARVVGEDGEAWPLQPHTDYVSRGTSYVNWRAIYPTYGDDLSGIPCVGISPSNLAKFAKVTDPEGDYAALRLTFGPSALKPIQVTAGDYFRGLIMPVRMPTE